MVAGTYTYDVYGEPTVTGSLGNEFGFAGQQTDPSTGLQYLRARYYDPVSGTFMSREPLAADPAWLGPGIGFGLNNPLRFLDPTGEAPAEVEDGCSRTGHGCWSVNDLVPHSGGTFKEYPSGKTLWCVQRLGFRENCRPVAAHEWSQASCKLNFNLTRVVCTNNFGGIVADIHIERGDTPFEDFIQDRMAWCGSGAVMGAGGSPKGALAGCAVGFAGGPEIGEALYRAFKWVFD